MKTEAEQLAWESHARDLDAKLLRVMQRRANASSVAFAQRPTRLAGGYWAALYRFRLEGAPRELVLRLMPTSDEQCAREAAVQSAVAAGGFPAPRVVASGGRDEGFGFPFIIMERLAGATLAAGMSASETFRVAWRLPSMLAATLAELHALQLGTFAAAQRLDDVLADLRARSEPLADGFAKGVDWLLRNRPASGESVLCHGDFHPLNVLLHDGRVTGLLDWTHAVAADREFDVAYAALMLELWPLDAKLFPRALLKRLVGASASRQFVSAYRRHAALGTDRLAWYEALHAFRMLVRVARARAGITLPPLGPRHPWELVADDAASHFERLSGLAIELPVRCETRAAS